MKVNLFRGFTEASNICGKYKLTKVESCNSNLKFTELFPWGNACDGIKNVDICKRVKDLADDKEHVVKCMKAAGKDKDGRPIIDEQGRPLFVEDKDKICCDKVTTKGKHQISIDIDLPYPDPDSGGICSVKGTITALIEIDATLGQCKDKK